MVARVFLHPPDRWYQLVVAVRKAAVPELSVRFIIVKIGYCGYEICCVFDYPARFNCDSHLTAPASCRNWVRGSFMTVPPWRHQSYIPVAVPQKGLASVLWPDPEGRVGASHRRPIGHQRTCRRNKTPALPLERPRDSCPLSRLWLPVASHHRVRSQGAEKALCDEFEEMAQRRA